MARQLTRTDNIKAGDLAVIFSASAQDYRGAPLDVLVAYLNGALEIQPIKKTQYSQPNATGFIVEIENNNTHLILTPITNYADGEIVLPKDPADKSEVSMNTTRGVTSFDVTGNGALVTGAPTTLSANSFFTLRYDEVMNTWYRVG